MKIEMGESLFYSWLRHVKECQIVQTNWKVSSQWQLSDGDALEELMAFVDRHYSQKYGYDFTFRIIANEAYNDLVLKPILLVSDGVADTSELFLRSYQVYKMFSDVNTTTKRTRGIASNSKAEPMEYDYTDADVYQELKLGQLAQKVLGRMLCDGCASEEEIAAMQTPEYSKQQFDLQYPLLRSATESETPLHYYGKPLEINGTRYRMCCEWFEKKGGNNDRPYLLKWIEEHRRQKVNDRSQP